MWTAMRAQHDAINLTVVQSSAGVGQVYRRNKVKVNWIPKGLHQLTVIHSFVGVGQGSRINNEVGRRPSYPLVSDTA